MNDFLTAFLHIRRRSALVAISLLVGLSACGDDDDPVVMIDEPSSGDSFSSSDDVDATLDGIQIDVSVIVDNESEGEEVWLYTDATILSGDPDAEPTMVETLPADGRVTFRPTLAEGTHNLLACVRDCRYRSQQVTITVTTSCSGVVFLDPSPGAGDTTNLGPDDDVDGEACGTTFTTDVRLSTTADDGTSFQLFVNGTPGPTAVSATGLVRFDGVVLGGRGMDANTLSVQVTDSDGGTCRQEYPNPILVDCDGTSCAITLPDTMRSVLNQSDDVSAEDGFQADFEITAGADGIGETFNLIVDGEILTATSVGAGGSAVASYNAIDLSEGRHTVVAECFDSSGIETRTAPSEWIVDTVGCDITVADPVADTLFIDSDDIDSATEGIQINTSGTVSGVGCESVAAGPCSGTPDPVDLSGSSFSGPVTLASAPSQELCVVVTDDAGNETEARVPLRLRTDAPQLEIVTPSGPIDVNVAGTGGAQADLDTGTSACDVAFTVNCTDVGSDVQIRTATGTVLGTVQCMAMAGLPAPFAGTATFTSVPVPSRNDGSPLNVVARQEVDGLVGSSAPLAITPDCSVPVLSFTSPMCGGVLRPSDDDVDPGTPGFQAFIEIFNTVANNANATTVVATTSGGSPVNSQMTSARFGEAIRFPSYDLGSGGELVLRACAVDQAGNQGCTADCPVTVADLPAVNIIEPLADAPLNMSNDCDGGTAGLQLLVEASTDAADGSDARVIFGSNPAVTTTVSGGMVSVCVDAEDGALVPVRVEVDGTSGTGTATVFVDVDSEPPTDVIDDLAVGSVVDRRGGTVRLTWTSVGDADGATLRNTEVRCARTAITNESEWDAAESRLLRSPSASPSSMVAEDVGGFQVGVQYFCAVRSYDVGNQPTPLGAPASIPVQVDFLQTSVELTGSVEMGWFVAPIGDIDGDLIQDFAASGGGEVYLFFGRTTPMAVEAPDVIIQGGPDIGGKALGNMDALGDFNDDGFDDFVLSSRLDNSAFVFFGRADRASWGTAPIVVGSTLCAPQVLCIRGEAASQAFGSRVRDLGDFNGDGLTDLGVGAILAGSNFAGRAYVILGSDTFGAMNDVTVDTLSGFYIDSTIAPTRQFIGRGLTGMGDLTGDGRSDIFVAGNGASSVPTAASVRRVNGRAHTGPGLDRIEWDTLSVIATGPATFFGSPLASLGDMDGNGSPDLAIAQLQSVGRVFTYTGESAFATGFLILNDLPSAGGDLFGETIGSGFHPSLGALGQIDETGSAMEVLVGAARTSGMAGDARLYYGPTSTASGRTDADVILTPTLSGSDTAQTARTNFVGDINADGHPDIAVGQPNWPSGVASGEPGRVTIFY